MNIDDQVIDIIFEHNKDKKFVSILDKIHFFKELKYDLPLQCIKLNTKIFQSTYAAARFYEFHFLAHNFSSSFTITINLFLIPNATSKIL